eukprot:PhF_6_TR37691/c0_g1_i1/m.56100
MRTIVLFTVGLFLCCNAQEDTPQQPPPPPPGSPQPLTKSQLCIACKSVVSDMMDFVYHRRQLPASFPTHPKPHQIFQHIEFDAKRKGRKDVVEYIHVLTKNRKLDTLLRDLVERPPSTRRLSLSAIQDIFRKSICVDATEVCKTVEDDDDRAG